jgi:hypothetical protein
VETRCAANDKSFKLRLRSISSFVYSFVPCLPPYREAISQVLYACDQSTLPSLVPPHFTQAIYHECYTLVILIFLLGLQYLGSELRSANRLPDFSAVSCTEPLLVLSTWLPHMQAIPSRVLYARDSVLSAQTLPWIGIAQCQSPARFLSCVVYRTSAPGYLICRQYPRECYTPVTPFFLLRLYLGSESRSANCLPDFSAASCTEPLLLPSICPPVISVERA